MNEKLNKIKALISDIDGVWTDGKIIYDSAGIETKQFNVKDGMIIRPLREMGFKVGIITGRSSPIVAHRAEELGLDFHFHGVSNKLSIYQNIKTQFGLLDEEIAYIGDDLNDYAVLKACGFSACPADATDYIKTIVDWVTPRRGGEGAFRDLADRIILAQNRWDDFVRLAT